MESYATLMFTPAVQAEQQTAGTRDLYASKYPERTKDSLGPEESTFLQSRSSIYMASVSETGWPYIQHRGGPAGFLKVLDTETIGFADYRGNRQFITKGNLTGDDRVSLFAMDYARKARLKLQGHAKVVEAADNPELAKQLETDGAGRVERLVTICIVAFDWNCPQFIEPRYTQAEVTALVAPHLAERDRKIEELTQELAAAKSQLNETSNEQP